MKKNIRWKWSILPQESFLYHIVFLQVETLVSLIARLKFLRNKQSDFKNIKWFLGCLELRIKNICLIVKISYVNFNICVKFQSVFFSTV